MASDDLIGLLNQIGSGHGEMLSIGRIPETSSGQGVTINNRQDGLGGVIRAKLEKGLVGGPTRNLLPASVIATQGPASELAPKSTPTPPASLPSSAGQKK